MKTKKKKDLEIITDFKEIPIQVSQEQDVVMLCNKYFC